jgi:hypothetical protein
VREIAAAIGFLATILAANWATSHYMEQLKAAFPDNPITVVETTGMLVVPPGDA